MERDSWTGGKSSRLPSRIWEKHWGVTPQHVSLIEQDKAAPSLSLLAGLARELGTTTDYLISGKEGIITETIAAIKADKRLRIKTKKALIALVEEFYGSE